MATDWAALWQALNERQRIYLLALFRFDQEAEQLYRHGWSFYRDGAPPPADTWRWIRYGTDLAEDQPPLKQALLGADLVSQGTGATWRALDERGYLVREWRDELGLKALFVQMTTRGRKLVRAADPSAPRVPKKPTTGALREEHWRALAALYAAGQAGVERGGEGRTVDGTACWWLAARRQPPLLRGQGDRWQETWFITEAGVTFYEAGWERHRALYPAVAAPEPRGLVAPEPTHVIQDGLDLTLLARAVRARRGERGLRAAAEESGLRPTTLSRLEGANPLAQVEVETLLPPLLVWLAEPIETFQIGPLLADGVTSPYDIEAVAAAVLERGGHLPTQQLTAEIGLPLGPLFRLLGDKRVLSEAAMQRVFAWLGVAGETFVQDEVAEGSG